MRKNVKLDNFKAQDLLDERQLKVIVKIAMSKVNSEILRKNLWNSVKEKITKEHVIAEKDVKNIEVTISDETVIGDKVMKDVLILFPDNDLKIEKLYDEFSQILLQMHIIKTYWLE